MSKQVELKDGYLYIHTREDYENANKIVMICKGKKAKAFYPYIPQFINDLESVKDWTICGYRVEDLVILSRTLREKGINDVDLKDYNACYIAGYKRASDDIHAQLEASVNRMYDTIAKEHDNG